MSSLTKKNLILLLIAIGLIVTPLVMLKDSEFMGADSKAQDAITKIQPEY